MEAGSRLLTTTDLATVTTTKQDEYGGVGATMDGRRYRYVQYGGAVTAGNLVIAPSLTTGHQNINVAVNAAANTNTVVVTLGNAAATQDMYADGLLTVGVTSAGVPITRKIKGNTAGAANTNITVTLYTREPLLYALTTSNVVSLSPSFFNGVVTSTTAGLPMGIATTSAAANTWGWILVYGQVAAVNDAAAALTSLGKIKQSTTVAGAITASTAATDIQIGTVVQPMAASTAGLIKFTAD